jgi:hypothetical protein
MSKTFSQFLDEALASFLVKAAARSIFRNKALTQKVAKSVIKPSAMTAKVGNVTKTITKPRQITGFQTARGSKYTYTSRPKPQPPQTQRTAAVDPYHPTAPGQKQKSDWTLFTTPDASMTMRQRFVSGSKEPFHQGLPKSPTPKIGRAPVEVWNQYAEKGGRQAIHPGSPITDIQTKTSGSGIGLYGAQRKELADRVKAALKRPANTKALKKELGIKPELNVTRVPSVASSNLYRNLGAGRRESVREGKSFSQFLNESQKVLNRISRNYSRRYRGVNVDVSHDPKTDSIRVNQLFVPQELRGKGIGTRVMKGLGMYADRTNNRITLNQDPDPGKKAKLAKFYKSHDFVPNRGRNRDFTTRDTYIRHPKRDT